MSYYKGSIEFSSKTLENSDVLSDILEAFSSDKDNMCAGPGDNLFATFIDAAQKGDSLCVMSDYKKGPGFVLEFDRTRQIIMITVSRIEYGRFSELQDVLIKHKQSFNSYSFGDGNYGSQTCVYRADVSKEIIEFPNYSESKSDNPHLPIFAEFLSDMSNSIRNILVGQEKPEEKNTKIATLIQSCYEQSINAYIEKKYPW